MPENDTTEPAGEVPIETVKVLLPLPVPGPYDYAVPDDIDVPLGSIVCVPLGSREVTGVVWDEGGDDVSRDKLRSILDVKDVPPLTSALRAFVSWVARYNVATESSVLRMILRVPEAYDPLPPLKALRRAAGEPARLTPSRSRVLKIMADGLARLPKEIAFQAGVGASVVKGLLKAGVLEEAILPPRRLLPESDPETIGPELSPDQAEAAAMLSEAVDARTFETIVLEGVTGSGKTEVYFDAIARALTLGCQVLVLLPEIALSTQFLARFEARFGAPPAMWHSDVPRRLRRDVWRGVATGDVRVVVGARSALFLPFENLGMIVVDEEHDGSYKQDDGVCYHARDMAVVRASLEEVPVVLCSATPSLETLVNVEKGRYHHLYLASRHGGAELPEVQAVDMTRAGTERGRWLSPSLVESLKVCLDSGEQALLYLNRRGYAPLTLCRTCGYRLACPNCSAWLVEHRHRGRLQCHHCGIWSPRPKACPQCSDTESLVACGPGVERLAEEVAERFPDSRLEIMASDTLMGPDDVAALIRKIEYGELDILIGTQVAAKGHHFPMLTLVGVVDADLGLDGGDPRAMERTWQLLHQVSGRAGREERPGKVLLQTYEPGHPVMHALVTGDREQFLDREKQGREQAGMPPFGRLAGIVVSGTDEGAVRRLAHDLGNTAPRGRGIDTFGPAPAPLSLLRGRFRWRLLVKADRDVALQNALRAWLEPVRLKGSLRLQVDVDPQSFL
ncbi:MAG: primosomal protein N' [Rhodospirillaceae bacterium]|nr:primosomal protein N' [Rhodospirillaceae bacterium]|tara:strand:+ start:22292 stop:24493 length:2202 start_codon:yes stop_codon:yes gene_type:complete